MPEMGISTTGASKFLSMPKLICNGFFYLHPEEPGFIQILSQPLLGAGQLDLMGNSLLLLTPNQKPLCKFTFYSAHWSHSGHRPSTKYFVSVVLKLDNTSELTQKLDY